VFNLEQSITEWRQQMLAAGIKTPVPLEELEIHLREEIERQMKSGSREKEIFDAAVQKIGHGKALRKEFKKIGGQKVGWTILWIVGWIVVGCALQYGLFGLDFSWNFMSFDPRWNLQTIVAMLIILVAEAGIWFLAKMSRDKASRIISLLICLYLAWFAIFHCFPAEQKNDVHVHGDGYGVGGFIAAMLRDRKPSPIWYRGGLGLLAMLPIILWIGRGAQRAVQKRRLTHKKQPFYSS
jgi:hypothetical protein